MMRYSINSKIIESFISRELNCYHEKQPVATLLDIGSGDMRYRSQCKKSEWYCVFSDYEIRSKDISMCLDAHSLPFQDSNFDIVLLVEVLEHLHHPAVSLAEIARVMKPSGIMLLTVPFLQGLHEIPHDYFRYTEFGIQRLLEDAGLQIVRFERRGDLVGVILSLISISLVGMVEAIKRTRVLSPIGYILGPVVRGSERLILSAYMKIFKHRLSRMNDVPGANLRGVTGHLGMWHLGYNFVCRKL